MTRAEYLFITNNHGITDEIVYHYYLEFNDVKLSYNNFLKFWEPLKETVERKKLDSLYEIIQDYFDKKLHIVQVYKINKIIKIEEQLELLGII